MVQRKTPAQRLAARAPAFAAAQPRHNHGRPFTETPRAFVPVAPISVTPPHEIEAARVRSDHSVKPAPDATFTPAEATDGSKT